MPGTSLLYRGAIRLATTLLPAAALLDAKLAVAREVRAGVLDRARRWGREGRDPGRPLVWFHAPSVGEGLQAEAVIRALREQHPGCQLAYTHFSPSAEALARRIGADFADYLPWDTAEAVDAFLDALRPTVLVFTKLDLWPELATRASARGIRVVLVAATVRPGSGRLGWPARDLLAPGYAALDAVGAVDPADAGRLSALGARPERITVTGDPRYDSVIAKVAAVRADDPLLAWGKGASTLVAGSTWEGDEAVILPAFAAVRARSPAARLILVPHEPTAAHLAQVEAAARALDLPAPVRLSAASAPVPFLLVDRVGVLMALYGGGSMAYVGGGYQRAGLHSVVEPAAWGVPILMGPGWTENRDAAALREAGGAVGLPHGSGATAELTRHWSEWLADDAERGRRGARARGIVDGGLGASRRSADLVAAGLRAG
jgi:3-deoxy-D-manno-octulosonic-acid transferase